MKRSHASAGQGAVVCLVALACLTPAARADEEAANGAAPKSFKLHASHMAQPEAASPELVIADGWHLPGRVNAALVEQIGAVRSSLPSWNGVHHMIPAGKGIN